jgi:PAS domain S-box-containing protein
MSHPPPESTGPMDAKVPSSGPSDRKDPCLPVDPSERVWWGSGESKTLQFPPSGVQTPEPRPSLQEKTFEIAAETASVPVPSPREPRREPGRYLIREEIGRGGVGLVYRGWDVSLDREIAVKVLLEEHRNKPEVVRRFLEEARITSRLQHPGVVPIHEMGLSPDGLPFFAMQLVRGRTMDDILKHREDSASELARLLTIFVQVCQTVAYAHRLGVIHRDLKPANIMIGEFGVVKVTDWGLAKVIDEPELTDAIAAAQAAAALGRSGRPTDSPPTQIATMSGTIFGTPAYLPPEQARGEIERINRHADVFGLGSILCEILTGSPPYTGADGWEIFHKAAGAELGSAIARLNDSPAALDLITLAKWCLSPEQDDRPAEAAEVAEVMSAYMQTDQRRAELDLVRFFDLSLDLFCIASADGYFLRVNKNFPTVLGYSVEELTSRPFVEFVHPDDRERTNAECARIASGSPCVRFLNRYRHAEGHYLVFEWNAQSIPEERAIYAVARNLTDRPPHPSE